MNNFWNCIGLPSVKEMQDLKERAARRVAFEGKMDGSAEVQIRQCVSGHEVLSEVEGDV